MVPGTAHTCTAGETERVGVGDRYSHYYLSHSTALPLRVVFSHGALSRRGALLSKLAIIIIAARKLPHGQISKLTYTCIHEEFILSLMPRLRHTHTIYNLRFHF